MIGVIDTSALVRLFIPDGPLPDGFEQFLAGTERGINVAIAPELLLVEVANVLNKKRKSGELTHEESENLLSDILSVPIRIFSHRPLLLKAYEMAGEHGLTVYDTMYLALAVQQGAVVYSADTRLVKVAARLNLTI